MDALQKINQAGADIEEALSSVNALYVSKSEELVAVNEAISLGKDELSKITSSIDEQRRLHDEELQVLNGKVNEAQSRLDDLLKLVSKANDDLRAAKKKHDDFVAYQLRAQAALSTRESSILQREEQLETTIAQSRRRKGILDDVT